MFNAQTENCLKDKRRVRLQDVNGRTPASVQSNKWKSKFMFYMLIGVKDALFLYLHKVRAAMRTYIGHFW